MSRRALAEPPEFCFSLEFARALAACTNRFNASGDAATPTNPIKDPVRLTLTRNLLGTCHFRRRNLAAMTLTTWRDIADQLTPEQVGELERWEALCDEPSTLLLFASEYAWGNKTRVFVNLERRIGDVRLRVCGRLQRDGSAERWVELSAPNVRLSDEQIHELCAALLDFRR